MRAGRRHKGEALREGTEMTGRNVSMLKRPRNPMPGFVRTALTDGKLMQSY